MVVIFFLNRGVDCELIYNEIMACLEFGFDLF